MTRILLIGKNGQVGWELQRTLAPLGTVIAPGRDELDLSNPAGIAASVADIKPGLIVNVAAYTAVDEAELEPDLAFAVNRDAPGELAAAAKKCGAAIIHFSTDYVYDGRKSSPYVEADATGPQNVYGRSKLAGEKAIAAAGAPHLILRTSWVYGLRGANFLRTMLRLAAERPVLRVVNDQFSSPNWCRILAEATALAAARWQGDAALSGVYHLTAQGQTSWHGFAVALLRQAVECGVLVDPACLPDAVQAIPTSEYPTPAARPANSVLDGGKLHTDFGITLPDWQEQLRLAFEK